MVCNRARMGLMLLPASDPQARQLAPCRLRVPSDTGPARWIVSPAIVGSAGSIVANFLLALLLSLPRFMSAHGPNPRDRVSGYTRCTGRQRFRYPPPVVSYFSTPPPAELPVCPAYFRRKDLSPLRTVFSLSADASVFWKGLLLPNGRYARHIYATSGKRTVAVT